MNRLTISLLGPMRVTLDGNPARFEADTARALLAYLVVNTETPQRREALAGLLWPEQPERVALRNLRQALKRLRSAIGDRDADAAPPFLLVTRKTVQFNRGSDYRLDVGTFTDSIAASQEHRHRRLEVCRPCMQRLGEAVEVYRREFLAGFSLPSLSFDEWLVVQRERLHRQVLVALGHLAAYYERRGEWEQARGYAQRQIELEPWQESAHRALMRALALSGARTAALAQYKACRRTLAEELGVEPEEETKALHERIRDGVELEALSPIPPHNLPVQPTPFLGREALLAEIEERLGDPDCRLLTLVGPGGSGKTRLAVEAGTAQVYAFDHGVFFVSLAPLQSVEAIVPTVARALGLSFHEREKPKQQLLDYVRQKSILLIMDNFEHLLDGVGIVTDLLKTALHLSILITSRARLNVQGERIFSVAGMDVPDMETAEELVAAQSLPKDAARYGAIKLFSTSACRTQPDFELTADNLTDVTRVCRLVQGMPLGILLAAAWAEMLTPEEIATAIGQSLDFLETDLRDVPARQRSMRAAFDHSWNLLTTREHAVMRALSVFRGGFTQDAAQQVTGASLRELKGLVNKSLVHRELTGRYEVHELLRQYAADKLRRVEKLDQVPAAGEAARDRHCAYYTAALQQWDADLKGPRQQAALAEIEADVDNAYAAWTWAVEWMQVERLAQALDGLCGFYMWRGRYQEGEAVCRMAKGGLTATASDHGLRVLAKTLAWQGVFSGYSGRLDLASELIGQSLALLKGVKTDPHLWRWLTDRLAWVRFRQGNLEEAFALASSATEGLDLETGDDPMTLASLYNTLGGIFWRRGNLPEAVVYVESSLELWQSTGHTGGIAAAYTNLGILHYVQGMWPEAVDYFERAHTLRRENKHLPDQALNLSNLGQLRIAMGDHVQARKDLETGLAISQRLGDEFGIVLAEVGLAQLAVTQSRFEEAIAHIETVMGLSEAAGEHQIADARRLLALAQAGKGDLQTGLETAEQALEMAQTAGLAEMEADCRRVLGVLHARAGDYLEAEVLLHEAIDLCLQLNVPYGQGWALFELGRLYQNLAHIADPTQAEWRAKALTALGEAIEQFERLGAARDLQMVRATLSQLQAETAADRKVIDIRVSLIANRFEISDLEKDLLGGGEMGHVYRGTDTQTGQAVAIKVLKPEILASQPDIVARFIREGESLRQLNHPNIVQMVDAIEENGQHYIIMEYVAGGSLRDLLEAGKPLSVTRILEITLELADALSRAHHLGIIHRNLKPANVLLAEDGTPRLTDFGHAHLAASTRLTRTGELMGSVGYLSPEACNGEALDNRADLWALGVLLYEMLTGELPFMGETLIAAITAILTQPVPDLASLRPDAPDALVELVCRMLEKDRQRRIPSARLVGAELEAILGVVSSQ